MRAEFEVADIIRQFLPTLVAQKSLLSHHTNTLKLLRDCRSAAMGGHLDACDSCGHVRISYNSCRNRHCPKCQGLRKEMWLVQQEDMLLPVVYFHIVFTLPHELNVLCLHQPKFMYDLLFHSAWYTIHILARDEQWLGAQTAATMVLHTWSQTMVLHPHVHCMVPNGGLTQSGDWVYPKRSKSNFLFPIKAIQQVFKGCFLGQLKQAIKAKELTLPVGFSQGIAYKKWLDLLYHKNWVVYTKKPFSQVKNVVHYLGRYSHRVAITNHRIKKIEDGEVIFEYKDYRDKAKKKWMRLQGEEFLRRFCLHILPKGFRKVRQYGFLSNAIKAKSLAKARRSLGEKARSLLHRTQRKKLAQQRLFGQKTDRCPCCKTGTMRLIEGWERNKSPPDWIVAAFRSAST